MRKIKKIKCCKTVLLVLEGDTEQVYFSQLKEFERLQGFTVYPKMAQHSDLGHILDQAIEGKESGAYDYVWCIFDRDSLYTFNVPKSLEDKIKNAEDLGIRFADSFPSFEIWFLLHYKIPNVTYSNQNIIIKELCSYINGYSKERKWLERKQIYSYLKKYQLQAIENSKKLEEKTKNADFEEKSVCNVYKLIKDILDI